jgi:uncharacterized protein YigA (DUF484 family)
MNEREVADFLLSNPGFFARHAELLATIKLTSPHGNRAISLQERQMEMLREKNKQLERRLAELMRHGHENDSIVSRLTDWTARIVAERCAHALPQTLIGGLAEVFEIPAVALRIWDLASSHADADFAASVGEEIRRFASSLTLPYCGPNTGFAAAQWLSQPQAAGNASLALAAPVRASDSDHSDNSALKSKSAEPMMTELTFESAKSSAAFASVALIALRPPAKSANPPIELAQAPVSSAVFGLLVMGSPDSRRFHPGMATDFLEQIGYLASSALSRLLPH